MNTIRASDTLCEMTSQEPDADVIASKLGIVDEIFDRFLKTNIFRGQKQSLEDIMSIERDRYLKYAHGSDHFLAELKVIDAFDTKTVEIRLSNGVAPKDLTAYFKKDDVDHDHDQWTCLSEIWLHWLPMLQAAMRATHSITEIWYHEGDHRVEILLEAADRSKCPRLLMIFAPQYPYVEDEFTYWAQPL